MWSKLNEECLKRLKSRVQTFSITGKRKRSIKTHSNSLKSQWVQFIWHQFISVSVHEGDSGEEMCLLTGTNLQQNQSQDGTRLFDHLCHHRVLFDQSHQKLSSSHNGATANQSVELNFKQAVRLQPWDVTDLCDWSKNKLYWAWTLRLTWRLAAHSAPRLHRRGGSRVRAEGERVRAIAHVRHGSFWWRACCGDQLCQRGRWPTSSQACVTISLNNHFHLASLASWRNDSEWIRAV